MDRILVKWPKTKSESNFRVDRCASWDSSRFSNWSGSFYDLSDSFSTDDKLYANDNKLICVLTDDHYQTVNLQNDINKIMIVQNMEIILSV